MQTLEEEPSDLIEISAPACEVAETVAAADILPAAAVGSAARTSSQKSYGQILKSSVLVGGSSLLNVAIGMVRTKVLALLLGPAGFGLFGVYNSIATLAQNLAGMGVNSSGVRQIAEAAGSDNKRRIAETSHVLRRVSFVLGVLGALLMVVLARPVAVITFGNSVHTAAVAGLAGVVLLMSISGGQSARIQGLRRIAELAKVSVASALGGTLLSIPLVYFLRERGIIPALIAVAATTLGASWWYSHRIPVESVTVSSAEVWRESAALLKLGFAFMSSGLMTMGVAYVVRITVLRKVGMEATGLYQSAWTLGGLYVAFILQAMGADFYPRLTACIRDREVANRLVNEQVEIGLLLAGPECSGDAHLRAARDRSLLQLAISSSGGDPALDLSRNLAAGRDLADGLHHRRQSEAGIVLLVRGGLGHCQPSAGVGLGECFRVERRGDRLFRLLHLSRRADLQRHPPAFRFPMVGGEYQALPHLLCGDGCGFCRAVFLVFQAGCRTGFGGNAGECHLLGSRTSSSGAA